MVPWIWMTNPARRMRQKYINRDSPRPRLSLFSSRIHHQPLDSPFPNMTSLLINQIIQRYQPALKKAARQNFQFDLARLEDAITTTLSNAPPDFQDQLDTLAIEKSEMETQLGEALQHLEAAEERCAQLEEQLAVERDRRLSMSESAPLVAQQPEELHHLRQRVVVLEALAAPACPKCRVCLRHRKHLPRRPAKDCRNCRTCRRCSAEAAKREGRPHPMARKRRTGEGTR